MRRAPARTLEPCARQAGEGRYPRAIDACGTLVVGPGFRRDEAMRTVAENTDSQFAATPDTPKASETAPGGSGLAFTNRLKVGVAKLLVNVCTKLPGALAAINFDRLDSSPCSGENGSRARRLWLAAIAADVTCRRRPAELPLTPMNAPRAAAAMAAVARPSSEWRHSCR